MRQFLTATMLLFSLAACKKNQADLAGEAGIGENSYTTYTILQGAHYCDKTNLQTFSDSQLVFKVKFDSSAIYQSANPGNQNDVNKLLGFSEGTDHHLNSARIGWAWYKNKLRLYAYVYSNGIRLIKEIIAIDIGAEVRCKVLVTPGNYVFFVDSTRVVVERSLGGAPLAGYRLFPYFGGDEVAPHNIRVQIQQVEE